MVWGGCYDLGAGSVRFRPALGILRNGKPELRVCQADKSNLVKEPGVDAALPFTASSRSFAACSFFTWPHVRRSP